uniref:hypothetical protein n=1 Tax=Limnohabitans sp. TaxID=1907725 RepID=UPI004047D257
YEIGAPPPGLATGIEQSMVTPLNLFSEKLARALDTALVDVILFFDTRAREGKDAPLDLKYLADWRNIRAV